MWRSIAFSVFLPVLVILSLVAFQLRVPYKPRLVIDNATHASNWALLRDNLSKSTTLRILQAEHVNPEEEIRDKHAEAVLYFPEDGKSLVLSYDSALPEQTVRQIEKEVAEARLATLKGMAEQQSIQAGYLDVFKIQPKPFTSSLSVFVQAIFDLVLVVLLRAAFSTNFAVQLVWSEEAQSKSLINILGLPVSRSAILLAKFSIIVLLGVVGSLVFFLSFLLIVFAAGAVGASAAHPAAAAVDTDYAKKIFSLNWVPFVAMTCFAQMILVVLYGSVGTIVMIAVKEKQLKSLLSFVFTLMALPLVAGFFPVTQLDARTEWIPTLNLALVLRSILDGTIQAHQWIIAVGESIVLIAILHFANLRLLQSERFMLNASE